MSKRPITYRFIGRGGANVGHYYEEFEEGQTFEHEPGRTITEGDNVQFCSMTMNTQPLHLDAEWAKDSPFGERVVNGLLTFSLAVGLSVPDLTEGTIIANLAYEDVEHPAPVYHGDTIRATSTILSKRLTSTPGRGLVKARTIATNQDDETVCRFERVILVETKDPDAAKPKDA